MAKNMEIERKFLIKTMPEDLDRNYPCHEIEQAYLCTEPVVRVRKKDEMYILTYKSKGLLSREEYNLPLNEEAYEKLRSKAEGNIITKKRYKIPYGIHTIELDVFEGKFEGLVLAEVEFMDEDEAKEFKVPEWFGKEVTYDLKYQNSNMSKEI